MPLEKTPSPDASERIIRLADQCVQCGLCLPVCPTYGLDQNEAESPRGRIALASALARGATAATAELREPLDHCLGCLGCEAACPAQVQFGELLLETRRLLGPAPGRPTQLLAVVKRPAALRWLRRIGRWTGLPRWKDGLARRLPAGSAWRAALQTWPGTAPAAVRGPVQPTGLSRVALFPGCIGSVDDAVAQQAALKLLQAAGIPVSVLPSFCCGAIDLHGGAAAAAATAARRVREAWAASGAEALLTVTSGCLGTLRRALPEISVVDPLSVLADHADQLHFRPLPLRAAVHLPCTLRNVAHSEQALLTLLRRVPALELTALPADSCCGAAGSHLLEYPERAARLRGVTLRQADALQPDLLLSSNIGCRLHLAAGMREQGLPWRQMHPLTLLAEQLVDPAPDLP